VNGGASVDFRSYAEVDSVTSTIRSGTTLAFWEDNALGLEFGPAISNSVTTRISNNLLTQTVFIGLEERASEQQLTRHAEGEKLARQTQSLGLQVSFSLLQLLGAYKKSFYQNARKIKDFLTFLQENRLLTDEELSALKFRLSSLGFTEDAGLEELIQEARRLKMEFTLSESSFRILHELFGLHSANSSDSLETISNAQSLQTISIAAILNVTSITGKPDIVLTKSCDKETAWYGSTLAYTIEFTNEGSIPAQGLKLVDFLPDGLVFQDVESDTHGASLSLLSDRERDVLTFSFSDLIHPGEKGHVTFRVYLSL
jgi:uncharacterized repeat protein (TIGR01451 family)